MTRTSSSSPACSILSSAAASGRSFTSRTSGRRITARRTARSCMKTRTTAHFPKAGEISSSRAICAFSRARSAFPARATCWNFTAAKPAFRSKAGRGCGQPYPVEYKRGKPKEGTEDALQLCGQAMCLEEMLCCEIPRGALYYGEPRRRTEVDFTPELRREVTALLSEMHDLYRRGHTPKVKPTKACNACSLKELCLPKLLRSRSVSAYLRGAMEDEP